METQTEQKTPTPSTQKTHTKHTTNLIIGFGKAGKTIAAKLGAQGIDTVLVEQDEGRYGGTCINVACLPTKHLVDIAEQYQTAKKLGLTFTDDEWVGKYKEIIQNKKQLIAKLREANYKKLAKLDSVEVITGKATFKNDNRVIIQTKDTEYEITADHIVINTGGLPRIPDIEGVTIEDRIYDSTSYMEEERFLPHLAILGAGYIGLEFAGIAKNLNSEVTVIQNSGEILSREDKDAQEAIEEHLSDKGIELRKNTNLTKVQQNGDKLTLSLKSITEETTMEVDGLLIATGRIPNTDGLGLENTSIKLTKRGEVEVDEKLQTSTENIWAAGDVKGGLQFTYTSLDDSRIILPQLLAKAPAHEADARGAIPYTMFLDPPFSRVGLSQEQAKEQGLDFVTYKMPFSEIPKSKIIGKTKGYWKILVEKDTNKLIGATLFGHNSDENINLLTFALNEGWTKEKLGEHMYNHPVIVEGMNQIFAESFRTEG